MSDVYRQVKHMNRIFTPEQKRHLYLLSDGKCQRCGSVLGWSWEAHHIIRWADGGPTELNNGIALCGPCHKMMHGGFMTIEPRGWQRRALKNYRTHNGLCFLADATPGAGKTYFSAFCAQVEKEETPSIFTVIVVPTTALKKSFLNSYHDVGISLTTVLKDGKGRPKEFGGAVITYQQLPNLISTFETWHALGQKMMFVFDEIHHASEDNKWGCAAESCGRMATKILAMTGTPFRSDGSKISFIHYDENNIAVSDASYNYREAVAQEDCREVFFMHDDGVAEYYKNEMDLERGNLTKSQISQAKNGEEYNVSKVIFKKDSEWLNKVLFKADQKLEQYRAVAPDAGGIIICRPGLDDNSDRHLKPIADMMETMTGERPEIITHEDKDANTKIEKFRSSHKRWIISVRKISEGVDIKRLRVMAILSYPSTELLFRQLVGRVVRVVNKGQNENATVFIAKFPQLVEWAAKIMEEAAQGVKDRKKNKGKENGNGINGSFFAKGCTHEHGGGTSIYGEQYNPIEITFAEHLKTNDPMLTSVSTAQVAHLCKKLGITPPEYEQATKPLHEQKMEKRKEISDLCNRIAYQKAEPGEKPDFAGVRKALNSILGVKNIDDLVDNHTIEKMDKAINVLWSMLEKDSCNV